MLGQVECPRCGRTSQADGIWVWVSGQGERLNVEAGRIVQSGPAQLFDLPCGCKFTVALWNLRVRSEVSTVRGGNVMVRVEPRHVLPGEITDG